MFVIVGDAARCGSEDGFGDTEGVEDGEEGDGNCRAELSGVIEVSEGLNPADEGADDTRWRRWG